MQIMQTGQRKAGVWKTCEMYLKSKVFTGKANNVRKLTFNKSDMGLARHSSWIIKHADSNTKNKKFSIAADQ